MSGPQSIQPTNNGESVNADSSAVAAPSDEWLGLPQAIWIRIAIVTALFGALFWPNLRRLWDKTNPFYGEANWGHSIGVPIIGLYYLYVNRELLFHPQLPPTPSARNAAIRVWGLLTLSMLLTLGLIHELAGEFFRLGAALSVVVSAGLAAGLWFFPKSKPAQTLRQYSSNWFGGYVVVFGIALFGYGIYPGQNDFVKDFGMVVTLFGVVLALTSWGVMRTAWFPIVFLVCAIPWPGLMYSRIAGPLQQLAASVAVRALEITGVEAHASGTKIFIAGHGGVMRTLNVAEACAGLRSLMTFIAVGGAVAFLSGRALWQKIFITLSAIPIAIFCNVMRVSGQGLLDHYVSQQLSENFAHQFVGMIMLVPAFLLILLVGWVLDQIFVEEADTRRGVSRVVRKTAGPKVVPPPAAGSIIRRAPATDRTPAIPPVATIPRASVPRPPLAFRPAPTQAARPASPPIAAARPSAIPTKPGPTKIPPSGPLSARAAYPTPPPFSHLAPGRSKLPAVPPTPGAKPVKAVPPLSPKAAAAAAAPSNKQVPKSIPPDSKREAV
jgi:exosortase